MKIKTIKKAIIYKLEDWLESITDKDLAKQVKEQLIVSGGCITSMLLKESVNDYDIYLKDINVLINLVRYYCDPLQVRVLDGREKEGYLSELKFDINDEESDINDFEKSLRYKNLHPEQVKLDISGEGLRFEVKEGDKYKVKFFSQNAISLSDYIQIVLRFTGSVEDIHKNFDFIHAVNYFTFKDGLVLNQASLESIVTRELRYQGSLYPITSILRMKKFISRNWTINAGEILKIMFQISELDLKDIKVLEEQLIGVDVAYFSQLIVALSKCKREDITLEYISTIIDRIFNK